MTGSRPIRRLDPVVVDDATARLYWRASLVTLAGNVLLAALKAVVAGMSRSTAIYADAINSISDVAYSVVMLIVLRLSVKPADEGHPHGHRRFEPLVSLGIGAMMALAGIEAGRSAVVALRDPVAMTATGWALAVPVVTASIKVALYLYVRRVGREAGSPALRATAVDHLNDILAAAVVMLGVGATAFGWMIADAVAGLLVAGWILWAAYQVLAEAIKHLAGGAPDRVLNEAIVEAVGAIEGVMEIDQVIVEYVGPYLRADIHIVMDGHTTLQYVHLTSHRVREAVEAFDQVGHAFVHVEPDERLP